MDFFEATKTCLRKYATFEGRAGRREYWWFALFFLIATSIATVFSEKLNAAVTLLLLLPAIAAATRRLHDAGKSGWMQLVGLIPLVGWIIVIVWLAQPSAGPNQYGAGPELPRDDPLGIPPGV